MTPGCIWWKQMCVTLFASIMVIFALITKCKMLQNKPAFSCFSATHQWLVTVLWWCYVQEPVYRILEPYLCWRLKWKMCTKATTGSLSAWGKASFKRVQVQTRLFDMQTLVIAIFVSYWPGSFAKKGLPSTNCFLDHRPLGLGSSSLLERERHVRAPKHNKESQHRCCRSACASASTIQTWQKLRYQGPVGSPSYSEVQRACLLG